MRRKQQRTLVYRAARQFGQTGRQAFEEFVAETETYREHEWMYNEADQCFEASTTNARFAVDITYHHGTPVWGVFRLS